MGMIQPEATPTKRVGTEAPVGSVAAGPRAGQAPGEFTKAGPAPGGAFKRQLEGANIGGITRLAEQPLLREAGQEATRVAQEGIGYKTGQQKYRAEQPQFKFGEKETPDVVKRLAEGDAGATETAQQIFTRGEIPVPEFQAGDIKEFTPLQALRGGSVESLLRKEAAGPYSTGMAGLDALLFQKKGGAQALANKGIALRTAEQATADALEKRLTEEAKKDAADFVSTQKASLLGGLQSGATTRRGDFQKRLDEAIKTRDVNYATAAQQSQQAAEALAMEEITRSNPNMPAGEREAIAKALAADAVKANISNLFKPSATATLADIASPEEEAQYARLLSLLGMGGADIKPLGIGADTSALAARPAITREGFIEGDRANIDAMNAYREAAINAMMAYRRANAGAYGETMPTPTAPEPTPYEQENFGPKTTGEKTTFRESDLPDRRGRYA